MNKMVSNILFFVLVLICQLVVFTNTSIPVSDSYTIFFFVYPMILLGLPMNINHALSILIAFALGLLVDVQENTLGVNAGAFILTAFLRPFVIKLLEPVDGYSKVHQFPTLNDLGMSWYARYSGILLFVHILMFFVLEYFSVVFIGSILIQTILSFIASWLMIILIAIIFRR